MAIVRAVAAGVVTVTLVCSVIAYMLLRRADTTGLLLIRSHHALATTEEILRRAVDAELGATAYVVFQHPESLASFNRAEQSIQSRLDELQWLVAGASDHEGIERLRLEIYGLFKTLRPMVKRAAAGDDVYARTYDEMNRRMDNIRRLVREIRSVETERLDARVAADESATRVVRVLTTVMTGVGTALAMAALSFTVWLVRPGWAPSITR